MQSLSFLFLYDFAGNANISVAIKSSSTVYLVIEVLYFDGDDNDLCYSIYC